MKYYNLARLIWPLAVVTGGCFFRLFVGVSFLFQVGSAVPKKDDRIMGIMGMLEVFESLVVE